MAGPQQFANWPASLDPGYAPYKAVIDRIVDGDTFYAFISVGFNAYTFESIRLMGVDAPELFTSDAVEREKGRAARSYLESIAPPGTKCLLRTDHDRTTFGRYVASAMTAEGVDLAGEMVAAGHARWSTY